ncbi:hypothetical protein ACIQKB_04155 [Streptomyces sp. NPDC092046]|uniref:hypothetical protein n=1 Tax=Streptomyces sp. NPDC092046 TaxID=3366009 RepID=UPI00382315FF
MDDVRDFYPDDLVFGNEASAVTGVPLTVIRKWASRGLINRFVGDPRQYSGQGHEFKTMYALPEVERRAATYKPNAAKRPKTTARAA